MLGANKQHSLTGWNIKEVNNCEGKQIQELNNREVDFFLGGHCVSSNLNLTKIY